ncbi:signal peptidase I [Paenibacillus oenotherae]|uniref:Signal peptidase I n=2 Tax=Paenibacillus oenotherae TaxID=1435645 RepID=A0ABS7D4U1_9BACL|nr:signal peptidase I [Paenibacillus oenotherae]
MKPDRPRKPGKDKPSKAMPRWAAELWDWGRTLLIAGTVVLLVNYFVFNLSTVEGHSMEPTLQEKEWLFVNKLSYRFGSPDHGDVVILKDPSKDGPQKKKFLVKRIIGIPGDTIEIRDAQLYRNGELIIEAYTDTEIDDDDYGPIKLEADNYYIMGDNRHAGGSKDSRVFGPVSRDMIQGRADFILWPITKMNAL